jgi:hypothetical protein
MKNSIINYKHLKITILFLVLVNISCTNENVEKEPQASSICIIKQEGTISSGVDQSNKLPFLGTMAGKQIYLESKVHGGANTYTRLYEAFGGSDDLRCAISQSWEAHGGAKGFKSIGEGYSYTPWPQFDGHPFSTRPTSMPGGGFFLTLQELQGNEISLNCFAYALGTYGEHLEKIAGMEMMEIQKAVCTTIDGIVSKYFHCVQDLPQDGDLAIYQKTIVNHFLAGVTITFNETTHAGIYRDSKPNWNSPRGGTIESKWGWGNPYIFQHDIFFCPHSYGDIVKFYWLKQ